MVGSIICGVDESASARGAARVARGLSRQLGLRLVFVRVVDEAGQQTKIWTRLSRGSSASPMVTLLRREMAD